MSKLPRPFFGGELRIGFSVGRSAAGIYNGALGCRIWGCGMKVECGEGGDTLDDGEAEVFGWVWRRGFGLY